MRAIAQYVGTRTATQVRTHAQKFYLKLQKEENAARERQLKAANGQGDNDEATPTKRRKRSTDAPLTALCVQHKTHNHFSPW